MNTDGSLNLVPYQQAPNPPMDDAHRAQSARALHVYTAEGQWLRAGRAALLVLARTTPAWRLFAKVTRFPPLLWGVEVGYWLVARNRGRIARWTR